MLIFIGVGIHPLSGAWEIVLIERFRVCLQACSCYFQHDTSSRIAQSGYYFPGLTLLRARRCECARPATLGGRLRISVNSEH